MAELGREKSTRRAQDRVHPAKLSVLPLQRPHPRRIRRGAPRPHPPVDLRLLGPAAQRVRLDPQLAAHLPAGRRHAGVLILDQVQHQPDRPVTQLVRILPCCSHRPTLPWIGSLHKTRGDSRWREENYFRYARTHFALDALDSHAAAPDDPDRKVPNPAKKAAAAQVRHAEILAAAAQAQRDTSLAALRNPAPGQPVTITNQMINALDAPVQAACRELEEADKAAAATPSRVPLGTLAPDMMRMEAEVKQITHAIRMAAYNAETTLARTLDGRYARAGDEACALIREALTTSGDIHPRPGQLLIRLDPLTAPRRTQALAALCDQLNQAASRYPGTDLVLSYEVKPHPGIA